MICLFFQVLSAATYGQVYKYHTVTPEENVFRIARMYDISEETIFKYNPDARNGVKVGDKLVIAVGEETTPEKKEEAATFKTHTVERRETLYSLSNEYGVSVDDIKRFNKELYSRELRRGETIRIPVFAEKISQDSKISPVAARILNTRQHVVLPKETKYGIARKYGMTVQELEKLNPSVEELQPGIMLKVSTEVLDEPVYLEGDNFEYYEVQPQETIFGLTRRFEIARDSLIALNPALKDGLKSGMVLKVPTKDARGRELDLEAYDKTEVAKTATVDLSNKIRYPETKNLVLMLPFNLDQVKKDTVSNAREVLRKDRVMRISLDFHSGFLMAVEKAKELGVSTRLRVYDTQAKTGSVSTLIYANNFEGVDAVVGPLLQATSEETAVLLSNRGIPVISPMTNAELRPIPNLYQARPSDNMLREEMINYLEENSEGKNIIILTGPESTSVRSRLQNALPQARLVSASKNNVSEAALAAVMAKNGQNWVILESESVAFLGSAVSALNRLARTHEISLFTTQKNNSFENDIISNEDLGRLNFHYPSEYREFTGTGRDGFIEAYKAKYGVIPNKYAVRGYDLGLDVILRLAAMKNLENSVASQVVTEYVESKFHYKARPGGGFYNDAIYILKMNPDLSLSVIR